MILLFKTFLLVLILSSIVTCRKRQEGERQREQEHMDKNVFLGLERTTISQ